MGFRRRYVPVLVGLLLLASLSATSARGETASASVNADPIKVVEEKIAAAKLAGDNAWMLTASTLVLLMTEPGLAMVYGGLVRKKNVLGVMMQCTLLMGMNSDIWAPFGYSLALAADPNS